jgi:hypothetical protein
VSAKCVVGDGRDQFDQLRFPKHAVRAGIAVVADVTRLHLLAAEVVDHLSFVDEGDNPLP